jgi:hypothetical protein
MSKLPTAAQMIRLNQLRRTILEHIDAASTLDPAGSAIISGSQDNVTFIARPHNDATQSDRSAAMFNAIHTALMAVGRVCVDHSMSEQAFMNMAATAYQLNVDEDRDDEDDQS